MDDELNHLTVLSLSFDNIIAVSVIYWPVLRAAPGIGIVLMEALLIFLPKILEGQPHTYIYVKSPLGPHFSCYTPAEPYELANRNRNAAYSRQPGSADDEMAYDQWNIRHEDAQKILRKAASESNLSYTDPEDAFSRTLLAGDTYSGIDAMPQFAPIDEPNAARLAAIATTGMSHDPAIAAYQMQATTVCQRRRYATTKDGHMGLVPLCAEVGISVRASRYLSSYELAKTVTSCLLGMHTHMALRKASF